MAAFTSLPLEIQQHIISYLFSIKDVAALAEQSRALRRLCDMQARREYHTVRIKPGTSYLDKAFNTLMDILRRPALGCYVRHIEVRHIEVSRVLPFWTQRTETGTQRELRDEEIQLLLDAVRKAGFMDQENEILNMLTLPTSADRTLRPQALGALLVSVSPYLESLSTTPFSQHVLDHPRLRRPVQRKPLDQLLRRVNANPEKPIPYLQNLRHIYIINETGSLLDDERYFKRMDFFHPISTICTLPAIESVGTDLLQEDDNGLTTLEPGSSNISKIAVHHSTVSSAYLAILIRSCKVLRVFEYSVGGRANVGGGYAIINPRSMLRALLVHKGTLGSLDLDLESYIFYFVDSFRDPIGPGEVECETWRYGDDSETRIPETLKQQTGSLCDFRTLKHLSIGVGLLLFWAKGLRTGIDTVESYSTFRLVDRLPPKLEYLCIRGYRKGDFPERDPHIEGLMDAIRAGKLELEVSGVSEMIPHAESVDNPDENPHLLWRPEKDAVCVN